LTNASRKSKLIPVLVTVGRTSALVLSGI